MSIEGENNINETNVAKLDQNDTTATNLKKAINHELLNRVSKSSMTFWKAEFSDSIDDMVRSFLNFPDSVPQSFRDKQFARHFLWRVGDNASKFQELFIKGTWPADFDFIWKRLMLYITGEPYDEVSTIDGRFMRVSIDFYKVVQDYIVLHQSDFNELMDRMVQTINVVRYLKS
ncbi:hypothetical protein IKD67_01995 [Candidatus Saccharibacteria bacterium]|nr:hypothetical protein [Candidatus Saccharibacteria bacterium]